MKVLLGLIFFWGFGWFWLRLEIIKFGFFILKWFWLVEIKNNKILTKMPRNLFNRCQETWPIHMNMFKCSYIFLENVDKNWNYGQKHDIVDKNFESTYEHLSEPRNIHTTFWVYSNVYTNTVHIFWVDSNVHTNSQKLSTLK